MLLDACVVTVVVPETVDPGSGEVMLILSVTGLLTVTGTVAEVLLPPELSVRTSYRL
jgi:hypothetical protein